MEPEVFATVMEEVLDSLPEEFHDRIRHVAVLWKTMVLFRFGGFGLLGHLSHSCLYHLQSLPCLW